ncbi:MAG: four helix bundle protein [bacterium]
MIVLDYVNDFKELEVYKLSRQLANEVYEITRDFPDEETYSLIDQIRRSSRSIGAQIAESWGKRRYERHFVSKLTDSDSEQLETQHWVDIAFDCGYIQEEKRKLLIDRCQKIGRMIQSMIEKSERFCNE